MEVFDELALYVCDIGRKGKLSGYFNADFYDTYLERDGKLDKLLAKINGRAIWYEENDNGDCSISVEVYRFQFANNGQGYYYNYNLSTISNYDVSKHTLDQIIEAKEDMRFDMPLISAENRPMWYFTFTYS